MKHLQIRLVEDVTLMILSWTRSQPERVYSEERSKLLLEVVLLQIGARCGRHPQFLRVISDLDIHETEKAKC